MHNRALPGFFSLILTIIALVLSIVIANILENPHIDTAYLTIALFTMFVGVLLIIGHKLIFSHMIGFLIIENAVFMLSMAVGKEMTMLINIGILLDVFVSVLVISILINRIGTEFNKFEVQDLTSLKH